MASEPIYENGCRCARCEFERENDNIGMHNEVAAIKSFLAPDEQARAEVSVNLNPVITPVISLENGPTPKQEGAATYWREQAEKARTASQEWEALYGRASQHLWEAHDKEYELREEVREINTTLDYELERCDFLEAALEHYASHAWNDLKRELEERWSR